jgi:hypothetical protein
MPVDSGPAPDVAENATSSSGCRVWRDVVMANVAAEATFAAGMSRQTRHFCRVGASEATFSDERTQENDE